MRKRHVKNEGRADSKQSAESNGRTRKKASQKDFSAREEEERKVTEDVSWNWKWMLVLVFFVLAFHQYNRYLLYTLFENSKHFSHLSTLEREMNYRTEMGMYYSYFKSMAKAKSAFDGIIGMTRDNLTEYPHTINALQRFNLLPEILVGLQYRAYMWLCYFFGCQDVVCWKINRGSKLPPVMACEGLAEPIYFYSYYVLEWNSVLLPITFLIGVIVTNSIGAGIVSAMAFIFNFGEATRVMWTPPLRESWAFPAIHLHLLLFSYMTRRWEKSSGKKGKVNLVCQLGIAICTFYSLVAWQFCHFNFSIFVIAVSALFTWQLISPQLFKAFMIPTSLSFLCSFALMWENKMMLTSSMSTTLASAWILYAFQRQNYNDAWLPLLFKLVAPVAVVLNSFILKSMVTNLFNISDEMHILNILKSKFTSFRDFHTMLYLCAKEFDFIGWNYVESMNYTFLLPLAVATVLCTCIHLAIHLLSPHVAIIRDKIEQLCMYDAQSDHLSIVVLQTLLATGYGLMSVLIMRLKLFFTPHLCILAGLLVSLDVNFLKCVPYCESARRFVKQGVISYLLLQSMYFGGCTRLTNALSRKGEFGDPELEHLLNWIKVNTKPDDSFAGSMSTMAIIKLTTNRPIVNHPHYEDSQARERNKKAYSAFGRFPVEVIHQNMKELGAKYLLLEVGWCWAERPVGCSIAEAFDHEFPELKDRPATCIRLTRKAYPFTEVFENENFVLLKV